MFGSLGRLGVVRDEESLSYDLEELLAPWVNGQISNEIRVLVQLFVDEFDVGTKLLVAVGMASNMDCRALMGSKASGRD